MTKPELKANIRLYRELDDLAVAARDRGDNRTEGRYLDARAEIGRIVHEADYKAWVSITSAKRHNTPSYRA
jgi:hypothetical protein